MNIFLIFMTVSTILHRFLLFSLPHNAGIIARPFSIICSLLSDISLLVLIWTIMTIISITLKKRYKVKKILSFFPTLIAFTWSLLLTVNLRYFDHFGMNIKPFHFSVATERNLVSTGVSILFQSKICWIFLISTAIITSLIYLLIAKNKIKKPVNL